MTQESQQAAMCENKLKGDSSHQGKREREKKYHIMLEKPLMWNSRKHCCNSVWNSKLRIDAFWFCSGRYGRD